MTVSLQRLRNGHPIGYPILTTTDAGGNYSFTDLAGATYKVTQMLPRHYTLTAPADGSYTISLGIEQNSPGYNFGDHARGKSSPARAGAAFANTLIPATFAVSIGDVSGSLFAIQHQQSLLAD
jgi:hypothetical protein